MAASRHILREHIFKILFDLNFHSETEMPEQIELYFQQVPDADDIANAPLDLDEGEIAYVTEKVKAVVEKIPQLDEAIGEVSVGWKISRMPKADLMILRLALYEIRYDDNVPAKVAINEAVELAKQYGNASTPGFVNGILARFV